jgi:DNA-binding GntR family transcriptional regulator
MRSIRARTIADQDRANRSIIDHMHIIEALENRDSDLAAKLVREHSMNLARHIEKYVDYLE